MRRLPIRLQLMSHIRRSPLGRWIIHRTRPLGSAPIALPHEERTPYHLHVLLPSLFRQYGLRIDHAPGFAFIVDAEDLGADFKGLASAGGWEGSKEGNGALAVDDASGVEFWDIWDRRGGIAG